MNKADLKSIWTTLEFEITRVQDMRAELTNVSLTLIRGRGTGEDYTPHRIAVTAKLSLHTTVEL